MFMDIKVCSKIKASSSTYKAPHSRSLKKLISTKQNLDILLLNLQLLHCNISVCTHYTFYMYYSRYSERFYFSFKSVKSFIVPQGGRI